MALPGISMPSSSGGLMRYNEEYKSRLMLTPTQIIFFIILIVSFISILKIFFPLAG